MGQAEWRKAGEGVIGKYMLCEASLLHVQLVKNQNGAFSSITDLSLWCVVQSRSAEGEW